MTIAPAELHRRAVVNAMNALEGLERPALRARGERFDAELRGEPLAPLTVAQQQRADVLLAQVRAYIEGYRDNRIVTEWTSEDVERLREAVELGKPLARLARLAVEQPDHPDLARTAAG